jgi:exopolyphosphatase/guanosine-5'-triphosphate,3'-diphosphate pyrophosphatase
MDSLSERSIEMRTIGIDLGSNTLRAVEYDCETKTFGSAHGTIVKSADNLAQTGVISDAAVKRIITGLLAMQETITFDGAVVRAVTTEAMRRAHNRQAVLARIDQATGVQFEIIDGEEEARLTLSAVENRLIQRSEQASPLQRFALIDIGGGSTELIFAYGDRVISRSFELGVVTVTQSHASLDAIREALPGLMEPVRTFAHDVMADQGQIDAFVATAGTPTTVASLKHGMDYATYDPRRINGTVLSADEPEKYLQQLLAVPFEERERLVGVGRADLILAGILLFEAFFGILDQERCTVIDDGLREGVALAQCPAKG